MFFWMKLTLLFDRRGTGAPGLLIDRLLLPLALESTVPIVRLVGTLSLVDWMLCLGAEIRKGAYGELSGILGPSPSMLKPGGAGFKNAAL
jgi:hypothetical protein